MPQHSPLYVLQFFLALVLAIFTELPTYYLFLKGNGSFQKIFSSTVVINIITVPIVWFILPVVGNYSFYVLCSESLAVLLELALIRAIFSVSFWRAFVSSVIANVTSLSLGTWMLQFIILR